MTAARGARPGLQRVEVDLGDGPERGVRAHAAHRAGRARRPRRGEHHRSRARARHRRLARRALEPRPRRLERARARPHHQGPLHEPPGRRRQHRGAPRVAGRGRVDRRHAGGRRGAAQPGAGGRGRVQGPRARGPARLRDDRRRRPARSRCPTSSPTCERKDLVDATVTCGHAFGGDYEAVSVFSALAVARHVAHADAAVVAMGPGIVGTNTRLGFSGMEVGPILDAAARSAGCPIACLRVSFADGRAAPLGLSHHSATALRLATRDRALVAVPGFRDASRRAPAGRPRRRRHRPPPRPRRRRRARRARALRPPRAADRVDGPARGRDPALFQAAAAAGTLAAQPRRWLSGRDG